MAANQKGRPTDYFVLGLSVFLIFCLLFDSYMVLPDPIIWIGHWHPLLLHFPIVLLLLVISLGALGKKVPEMLFSIAVISALLTAVTGFFLGKEVAIKGGTLWWHQWLGAGVALLATLWYALHRSKVPANKLLMTLQILLAGLIGFAGHFGGMVTHGEDYLALPSVKKGKKIPENPFIYKDVVYRILEDNCISCHNPNKQKGDLIMTSLDDLLKGGETGNTLIPGDPGESEIIRRLNLPVEHEDHMPPEEKRPLGEPEIQILERWIVLGASDTLRLNQLEINEPLAGLIKGLMEPDREEKWMGLPGLADSTLQRLSTDYLTIRRVASHTDALSINVYMPPEYNPKPVLDLKEVAANIVELDLSGLPLGQEELEMVAGCTNLEWLELDRTPVTDGQLKMLQNLEKLKVLKLYATTLGDSSIITLSRMKNLKHLYLFDTEMSEAAFEQLKSSNPGLSVNSGMGSEFPTYVAPADSVQQAL